MMTANDTVAITGISGRIAAANSVDEFEKYLYDGVDLIVEDDRWPKDYFGLSNKVGKINDYSKFDAEFFGINDQDADLLDPQIRVLIEVIFECISDAGQSMESIKGRRTGIFYGSFYNEIDRNLKPEHTEYLNLRQTFLGWLSYAFNVTGSCYMYETACSSSCTAIVEAVNALKRGSIDYAIVATSNTNYSPSYGLVFQRLGLVSTDGKCRFLDSNASGYVKSDAVTAFLLQRESNAKRIYAKILSAVSSADGYKNEGITFPKWTVQRNTIEEAYRLAGIDPLDVDYVEAHGTGTQVGDMQEINAIYQAFKVKDRKKSLLLGSVKTNVGHSEGSSGLTSLLKVIFTFKNESIPQSIHFNSPNVNIEPLMKGEVLPVISNTPFYGKVIGVNSFGFGGSNVHLVIGSFSKERDENSTKIIGNGVSRLVLFCGRNEDRVNEALDSIKELHTRNQLTKEYLSLVNDYSKMSIESGMKSRGYLILNTNESIKSSSTSPVKRPLYMVFGGLGQQMKAMAAPFMCFDAFAKSIRRSADIVDPLLNINLIDVLTNEDSEIDINKSIISLVPIAAFQMAMIDLMIEMGVEPDGYLGHSFGEFACGYFDGALTQEEYLISAIAVYKCTLFNGVSNGLMAATDLSREELISRQPRNIHLACDNSEQSITVAGNKEDMCRFVEELQNENRFARLVKTGGIAFHCPVVDIFIDSLSDEFTKVLNKKLTLSKKWISTSIKDFNPELVKEELLSSYFIRCVSGPVYFRDAVNQIPKDAVVVEISARKFMASILTRSLPSSVSVLHIYNESGVDKQKIADRMLSLFGDIYEFGFNLNIEKLYPSVCHPFDCKTSLSSIIKLDHSKTRLVRKFPEFFNSNSSDNYRINLKDEKWSFLYDHKINGNIVMPFSAYIYLIWDFVSREFGHNFSEMSILFEDINLHQNLILIESKASTLNLSFIEKDGRFKFAIKDNSRLIFSASIQLTKNIDYNPEECNHCFNCKPNMDEIYENMKEKGYQFGDYFKQIIQISSDFNAANVKWMKNYITFLESVFHLKYISNQQGRLISINYIESLQIDSSQFQEDDFIHVHYDKTSDETYAFTQSSQVALLVRNIHYESASTSSTNPVILRLPSGDLNESIVKYVCTDKDQIDNISILGVSGRKMDKMKFFGLIYNDNKNHKFKLDPLLTWSIPEEWPLSESAIIVSPFFTAYYSLLVRGRLNKGESVLILNAWTPIGIAAISICLDLVCNVTAAVKTRDEIKSLKTYFPQINLIKVYQSKNDEFEEQMMRSTNGNGFDLVLSSTFDDSIESNLRLIALNGRYLQIMSPEDRINAVLGLQVFLKNIAVHGVQISSILSMNDNECRINVKIRKFLHQLVDEGIKSGVVRPFPMNGLSVLNFGEVINVSCL